LKQRPIVEAVKYFLRLVTGITVAFILVMWVYALFFASKDSINKFSDRQWAAKAQQRCLLAIEERKQLADYRIVDSLGTDALGERADLVDKATDTIERFVLEFRKTLPTDPKGIALVTLWLNDYEIYIGDRRSFANDLRSGVNKQFSETSIEGLPLSEKIATFAADNEMKFCKPPIDLSL
jgi:hypothetical protein